MSLPSTPGTAGARADLSDLVPHALRAGVSSATVLGEITAALAHDLKQPLSAIGAEAAACSNWLTGNHLDSARLLASLEAIIDDVQRVNELVDRLQLLLVPASAHVECDVDRLAQRAASAIRVSLLERGCTLRSELATSGCQIYADAEQIEQVVTSLLLLAADACQGQDARVVILSTQVHADCARRSVEIAIAHKGGAAPDQPLPVRRVSAATDSTGAFLSVCRSIIERHGGRLQLRNEPHGTAVFSVRLPLSSDSPGNAP